MVRRRAVLLNSAVAALLVVALSWVHGPAVAFQYDAAQYWNGPMALLNSDSAVEAGALSIRGVLTVFVYLPPVVLSSVLGPVSAAWTVLAWNSLLAVAVCIFLLPRMAAMVAPGHALVRIWLSAALGGVLLSGFARYPLLDVWAVAIALAGLYALARGRRWWTALLAGAAFAVSTNLRPAYLIPVAIAAAVLLIARPRHVIWAAPGVVLGLIPQFMLNLVVYGSAGVVPIATPQLVSVQATSASWAVRYDTVLSSTRFPQQWWCDPGYAAQVAGDAAPTDQVGVVTSLLHHLPDSLWFLVEKAAGSLQWSFSTPYERGAAGTSPMSLLVVGVTVLGAVAMVVLAIRAGRERGRLVPTLAVLGFWLGSLATLVLSTPETRFAIPLALIGLVGTLAAVPSRRLDIRVARPLALGMILTVTLVLAAGLFVAGKIALSHPASAGQLTRASDCL